LACTGTENINNRLGYCLNIVVYSGHCILEMPTILLSKDYAVYPFTLHFSCLFCWPYSLSLSALHDFYSCCSFKYPKHLDAAGNAPYCIVVEWINRDRSFYCFCRRT